MITSAKYISKDNYRIEYVEDGVTKHIKGFDHPLRPIILAIMAPEAFVPIVRVPEVVSKYQAKMALLVTDQLDAVEALMADVNTPMAAKLAWSDATNFYRDSEFITLMAPALNMTDAEIDALFVYAFQI